MVKSVSNNGALSNSKVSSSSSAVESNLSYRLLNVIDTSKHQFFNAGVALRKDGQLVFFYDVVHTNNSETLVTDRAFMAPNKCVLYLEASRPISQLNKESLSSLLEMADDGGCTQVIALVRKDSNRLRDVICSYAACGFSLLPGPVFNSDVNNSFVTLKFDI